MANAPAIKWYRFLACITLLVLIGADFHVGSKDPVYARSPLTCPSTSCPIARVEGFQPVRYDLRSTFNDAASNNLGNNGPTYKSITRGIPPSMTQESISTNRPIPHIVLRGVAWQESHWLQFANSVSDPDNLTACTLVSGDCGYGVTQVTSCMDTNGCGWFTPSRVSGELAYNIGTGANFLIEKWNAVNFIGENDHTLAEEWYYAVTAYNGWDSSNDPNQFDPARPPYGEANYTNYAYPYQEKIWGIMAHPEIANLGTHQLWRNSRVTAVPRGIFGLGSGWQPPYATTKPISHLLSGIQITDGLGPSLTLQNSTANPLALDIMLYNDDGTFNRRWLGSPDPPYPPSFSPIRLSPNQTLTLSLASAFRPSQSFGGYARIDASEGISIALSYPNKTYLPLTIKNDMGSCHNEVLNGSFESTINGSPAVCQWLCTFSRVSVSLAGTDIRLNFRLRMTA